MCSFIFSSLYAVFAICTVVWVVASHSTATGHVQLCMWQNESFESWPVVQPDIRLLSACSEDSVGCNTMSTQAAWWKQHISSSSRSSASFLHQKTVLWSAVLVLSRAEDERKQTSRPLIKIRGHLFHRTLVRWMSFKQNDWNASCVARLHPNVTDFPPECKWTRKCSHPPLLCKCFQYN